MSRKPRWVLSLIKMFRLEKEELVTHRELIDEDFPIRRVHRISQEVEAPKRRRDDIEELVGLARLHGTPALPVAPVAQTQSTLPTQSTAPLSSVNVDALSTQQTNALQSSTTVQPVSAVAATSNSDPNLHAATHERVANLIQRVEKCAAQPVGRRSENKLTAARKTVNDIPALPNHEAKGHWFNNGQTRYPGSDPRKHSGTLHRLDSILATRTDEIQALDAKYTDGGDKK